MSEHQSVSKSQEAKKVTSESVSKETQTSFEDAAYDFSPEVMALKSLQTAADNSPRSNSITQLQATADESVNNDLNQILQLQAKADARETSLTEPIQRHQNNTGLPDNLKSGMENLSGLSMEDVKVHRNSDKPAQLNAHAYAQGSDIHLGPGQEKQLPHEAWHVVQQKQGRVQPTKQLRGKVNINDDGGLEKEADLMGQKALQMKNKNSEYKIRNINGVKMNNLIQPKLIIPDSGGNKQSYDNAKHGETQVKEALSNAGYENSMNDGWEGYLFAGENYEWNPESNSWEKYSQEEEVDEADVIRSDSTQMLIDFSKTTGMDAIGSVIGLVDMVLGTQATEGIRTLGIQNIQQLNELAKTKLSEVFWRMGIIANGFEVHLNDDFTLYNFTTGETMSFSPSLDNITKHQQFAGSEIKMHNMRADVEMQWKSLMDFVFKIPVFNTNVTINLVDPETGETSVNAEGNISISGLDIHVTSLDQSLPTILGRIISSGAMKAYQSAISGYENASFDDKTIKGNLGNAAAGALHGVGGGLVGISESIGKINTEIMEAFNANLKCENVIGSFSVVTNVRDQKNRLGFSTGKSEKDEFNASINLQNLELNKGAIEEKGDMTDNVSGSLESLDAEFSRKKGDKEEDRASLHLEGGFEDKESAKKAFADVSADVQGLKIPGSDSFPAKLFGAVPVIGKYGLGGVAANYAEKYANDYAGSEIESTIKGLVGGNEEQAAVDNKLDEKPITSFLSSGKEVLLIDVVLQILESSNKKSLYAGSILEEVKKIGGGDKITKQNVKDCLGYLISEDIAQIANPKVSSLWGRKKAYKMTPEPKPSMKDKILKNALTPGSKTNKTAAYIGGSAIYKKGLDVKINAGEDKKNQMSASLHVDKGLVIKGSTMSVAIEKAKKLLDDEKSTFST